MLRSTLSFLTLTFLFLTGACDPKSGDTDSGTASASTTDDSTTDASTTNESPTSGATDDGATTENDEPTVATSGDDTGDDTGSDTTGPVDPEQQSACEAACQRLIECEGEGGAEGGVAGCVQECVSEFQGLEAECVPLHLAAFQCVGKMTCDELFEEDACVAEFEAVEDCAGIGECSQEWSEEEEGCGVSTSCPGSATQEIFCTAETCVCTLDGVEVAQCPSDNVCAEGDAIFNKMASCCNFE